MNYQLIPMSIKTAFDKLPQGHREYVAVMLKRAISIGNAGILTEKRFPSLDEAFTLLGRATVRKELLKELQMKINKSLGFDFIIRRIERVNELIDCSDKEIELLNKMVRGILQKELPHVKSNRESVDVPVQVQS